MKFKSDRYEEAFLDTSLFIIICNTAFIFLTESLLTPLQGVGDGTDCAISPLAN